MNMEMEMLRGKITTPQDFFRTDFGHFQKYKKTPLLKVLLKPEIYLEKYVNP